MATEKTLFSRRIYEGRAVRLRIDTVQKPGGQETTREIVEHDACVVIVAVDGDDVLLVKQFRKPVEKELLELPAGGIEPGEDAAQAVVREMQEETGLRPQRLERLGGFYAAPGYDTEYLHLYLAAELVPGRLHAEDTDEIELVRVPLNKAVSMITSGKICDAKSIAGLLTYLEYRKTH